jgi:hypothetical protein
MNTANPSAAAIAAEDLRPLKWNERVQRGDFVADGRQGFEPWEGPGGFRADAFVKTIYRRSSRRSAASVKSP